VFVNKGAIRGAGEVGETGATPQPGDEGYLRAMGRIPLLRAEEERALARAVQADASPTTNCVTISALANA